MSFNWAHYLDVADELNTKTQPPVLVEARKRSAVSRAYYSLFCQARNFLRDSDGKTLPGDSTVHSFVQEQFKANADTRRREIGDSLDELRVYRNRVDYDDVVTKIDWLSTAAMIVAKSALETL